MNETEWDSCKDAMAMLTFLRGRSGERKMRLLACACARARWSVLTEDEYRRAVETAERCADGLASLKDLRAAQQDIFLIEFGWVGIPNFDAKKVADATVADFSPDAAEVAIRHTPSDGPALIREIFGNPFRNTSFDSSSLPRDNGRIKELARTIYEERCFDGLPRLADLLMQAGCLDAELLTHLRSPGPHFRGCWALDAVLGKGPGKDVVTEADWLHETHPFYMLTWWEYLRGKPSPRKYRLLACACCRLRWSALTDERLRRGVEVAEAFADGLVDHAELVQAHEYAHALGISVGETLGHTGSDSPERSALSLSWSVAHAVASAADPTSGFFGNAMHHAARDGGRGRDTKDAEQAKLVREVLGNPLREVIIDPAWLSGKGKAIVHLAQTIYDQRAFARLPALADALEEAGCPEPLLIEHFRRRASHVRGCWALDALLGRE